MKPRRPLSLRLLATLAAAGLAGALAMTVLAPSSQAIVIPQSFVTLNGEGAWSVKQELVPWQNELATASSSINLNYSARGSFFGREDFLNPTSGVDFAISGVPFTPDELSEVKGGESGLIAAPIDVATLAAIVEPPPGGFNTVIVRCDPDDPSTWPPGVTDGSIYCVVTEPVPGTIRIPARNLAAMFVGAPGPAGSPSLEEWNSPAIQSAMGVDNFALGIDPDAAPGFAGRSDPDEINYYLQEFVEETQPDLWQQTQALHPKATWDPITERMPVQIGVSRDGAEQQVDQLAQGGYGVGLGNTPSVLGGIAPAPPSTLQSFRSTFPGGLVTMAETQNANGDWVAPTPGSINAAVDAGGDVPLYALTHKVPNAYPLVWIDRLYAPAHGLSIAKTEGLAMLIRYLATTGQEKAGPVGEGSLPPALVSQALDAANSLVLSNCQGSDRQVVVSSDPGPLAPPTATAMKSIGPMAHCEPVAPATTTTSTPTSTTVATPTSIPVAPQGQFPSSDTPAIDQTPTVPGPPVGSGSTATSGTATDVGTSETSPVTGSVKARAPAHLTGLLTASKLPLPTPGSSSNGDRLATFLLGAGLYLIARRPVARLARKVVP